MSNKSNSSDFDPESYHLNTNNQLFDNISSPEPIDESLEINKGDKIIHDTFGEGIVMETKPTSNDVELTIVFKDGGGVKRFLGSIAPIKKQ
ncbi:MAG TPA: hypothetical protein EYO26_04085 [Dehalococcoidia bacterium]|nr:hypothetical protein [Dehalococcoidia bacterium]